MNKRQLLERKVYVSHISCKSSYIPLRLFGASLFWPPRATPSSTTLYDLVRAFICLGRLVVNHILFTARQGGCTVFSHYDVALLTMVFPIFWEKYGDHCLRCTFVNYLRHYWAYFLEKQTLLEAFESQCYRFIF